MLYLTEEGLRTKTSYFIGKFLPHKADKLQTVYIYIYNQLSISGIRKEDQCIHVPAKEVSAHY